MAKRIRTEVDRLRAKEYYEANKEKILARQKARRESPDYVKKPYDPEVRRKYRAENLEREKKSEREWRLRNPERTRALVAKKRAIRKGAEGFYTSDDLKHLFYKQRGRCAYCRESIGHGYHVDHFQPLSKQGSNWPWNIKLTCPPCNMRKKDKDPVEYGYTLLELFDSHFNHLEEIKHTGITTL